MFAAATSASAETECQQIIDDLPPRGEARIAAGRSCIEALPRLPRAEQIRVVREYARTLPDYIAPADIDSVVASLPADVALPLEAYAARYSAIGPGTELAERVDGLIARADAQQDDLAKAHLGFLRAARVWRNGGDSAAMENYLQEAMTLAEATGATGLIPYISNSLAVRAKVDGEFDVAIVRYREALAQFEASGDLGSTGITYANIGTIFSDLGDNEQAIEMYRRAIDTYLEHSPEQKQRLATVYVNLGSAFSENGAFDRSIEAFSSARQYSDELPTRRLDGLINYQNGLALFASGARPEAISMVRQSIDQILEHRDPSEAASALNWLAERHLEDREFSAAQTALNQSREIMEPEGKGADGLLANPGNTFWAQEYAESMGSLLMALGDRGEAAEYLKAALVLSNERFEKDKMSAVVNSELLFEVRDSDLRVKLLEDEAIIADLQLRQSRLQLLLAIAFAIAVVTLGAFLYKSYREQRRTANTKDMFLREIHHRTKNNLQLLSSLLSIDARRDSNLTGLPGGRRDAANRARTMALVHDHIYNVSVQDSTKIDVKLFLDDLIDLLRSSLGRDGIKLEGNIVSAKVDVDRMTPLGLIVTELVSNAYEHAFDEKGGTINVALVGEPGSLVLTVRDDGAGFDPKLVEEKEGSLGLSLIEDLSSQIDGEISVVSGKDGTVWTLSKAGTSPFFDQFSGSIEARD